MNKIYFLLLLFVSFNMNMIAQIEWKMTEPDIKDDRIHWYQSDPYYNPVDDRLYIVNKTESSISLYYFNDHKWFGNSMAIDYEACVPINSGSQFNEV